MGVQHNLLDKGILVLVHVQLLHAVQGASSTCETKHLPPVRSRSCLVRSYLFTHCTSNANATSTVQKGSLDPAATSKLMLPLWLQVRLSMTNAATQQAASRSKQQRFLLLLQSQGCRAAFTCCHFTPRASHSSFRPATVIWAQTWARFQDGRAM